MSTIGNKNSAKGSIWELVSADERITLAIVQQFNLPEITARILAARGFLPEDVTDFLSPTLRNLLPDPFHFLDMEKAANKICSSISKGEKIAIFGDYDVDGATSSALLKRYFRLCGNDPIIYIPDRIDEGYGPNIEAMEYLAKQGVKLCITVDCGTLSFEPIAAAKNANMDVIVIDHHLSAENLPEAIAIVNPNRLDETSQYRYLAAVGMCFMLTIAVNAKLKEQNWFGDNNISPPDLLQLLDLVALGTVCDVMPLIGINRAFVTQGLKILRTRNNVGLAALCDIAKIDNVPGSYHLGFVLGPRINAGGRVGKSDLGAKMLSTDNYEEAFQIAQELNKLNSERKTIEQLALDDAIAQTEKKDPSKPVIIASGNNWHPGVIGIVASRLKEKYNRPTAVISLDDKNIGKASARSVSGIDLGAAIISAQTKGILLKGGGHAMAAGFTVEEAKIPQLFDFLCERFANDPNIYSAHKLKISGFLTISSLNLHIAKSLTKLEPYGPSNSEPIFAISNAVIVKTNIVGQDHIICILKDNSPGTNNRSIKAMAFRSVETDLGKILLESVGKPINIAGKIRINNWQGYEKVEFFIEDAAQI